MSWPSVKFKGGCWAGQEREWLWPSTKYEFPYQGYYQLYLTGQRDDEGKEAFIADWHNFTLPPNPGPLEAIE